ncbi:hypothetical protein E2C01_096720 [Portunus trituberculatus]|uniref:Uncharacterized protein n=1 Tax=Portunus trituberculatus TaxID=210409 RepID=A0A5B7JT92_PORTR|nr:hypothetical protein [Portunus trituberculatus]
MEGKRPDALETFSCHFASKLWVARVPSQQPPVVGPTSGEAWGVPCSMTWPYLTCALPVTHKDHYFLPSKITPAWNIFPAHTHAVCLAPGGHDHTCTPALR